jgi:hypothetical protein
VIIASFRSKSEDGPGHASERSPKALPAGNDRARKAAPKRLSA